MFSKKVKLTIALSFLMIVTFNAYSKSFKFSPTLSVIESYTYFQNYTELNAGVFEMTNRPFNFGVELTQKIPLYSLHFLRIGLRYQSFKKNVYGLNQIDELYDFPHPFYWEYRYTALTVPLHFGKEFTINKTKRGDYYIGSSIGVFQNTYIEGGVTSPQPKSSNFFDKIISSSYSDGKMPIFFNANVELGINYIPIKKFTKLSVGCYASLQFNKVASTTNTAQINVPTLNYDYNYDITNEFRTINFSIVAGYTF